LVMGARNKPAFLLQNPSFSDEAFERLKEQFHENHGGFRNAQQADDS